MDIKGFLANGESAEVNIDALGRINSKLFSMSDYSWKVETDFFIMKPKLAEEQSESLKRSIISRSELIAAFTGTTAEFAAEQSRLQVQIGVDGQSKILFKTQQLRSRIVEKMLSEFRQSHFLCPDLVLAVSLLKLFTTYNISCHCDTRMGEELNLSLPEQPVIAILRINS
ncbi:unnamed protein product [Enterobius vermicularis]|uniref:Rad21_Rec8 domain-containing protein n=1 Tax=Enterobius vermicularis TaxID=51028 RepID=A0A0N4V844_ENTVE|nr:unnamed protein product [Enterobius vermicularis]